MSVNFQQLMQMRAEFLAFQATMPEELHEEIARLEGLNADLAQKLGVVDTIEKAKRAEATLLDAVNARIADLPIKEQALKDREAAVGKREDASNTAEIDLAANTKKAKDEILAAEKDNLDAYNAQLEVLHAKAAAFAEETSIKLDLLAAQQELLDASKKDIEEKTQKLASAFEMLR